MLNLLRKTSGGFIPTGDYIPEVNKQIVLNNFVFLSFRTRRYTRQVYIQILDDSFRTFGDIISLSDK